jgi:hypothetical protein
MPILKRLAVWSIEISLQAILLGLLLIGLYGHDQYTFGRGLLIYADSTLVMFFTTGYLLTTAISRTFWKARKLLPYSVIAMTLFILHFELLNIGIGGAFAPPDRVRVIVVGSCAALLTTLAGTSVLRRWTANSKLAEPQP